MKTGKCGFQNASLFGAETTTTAARLEEPSSALPVAVCMPPACRW
jgi:hypothetical protein